MMTLRIYIEIQIKLSCAKYQTSIPPKYKNIIESERAQYMCSSK